MDEEIITENVDLVHRTWVIEKGDHREYTDPVR
jgi:hypothetical protein